MTTSTNTPRLSYTADGSTAAFTFNFEIADSSSIDVYVGSTLKTLTTDYTVSFDSGTSGTGTVTFNSAPSSGTVTLVRDTNLARTTDFENSGAFLASTVNAELDRLSQAVIDATNKVETKAIILAEPTTETPTLTLPDAATRADKVLSFDSSGDVQVSAVGTGSVTSVGLTTSGNDLTITNTPVTTSGNINIEMANPITVNVTGNVTGDLTGNASTATALATARTIAGQSFDGTGNITIASTDLSNTSNITLNDASQTLTNKSLTSPTITGTGSIAGTFTGNIAGDVTGNITAGSGTSTLNNLRVSGDLTVDGTNTIINTDTIAVEDNILLLNRNVSGTPSVDSGIEVERGTSANKQFVWDESEDKWSIAGETLIASGIETGSITTVSNGDITLAPNGSGRILLTPGTNGVQVTTGNFSVNAGYLESEGVRINDNIISTTRSNDNLILDPAGTGSITLNSAVTTGGALTSGGNIAMGGNTITGLNTAAPSADGDVAHKKYVDDSVASFGSQIATLDTNVQTSDTGSNGTVTMVIDGTVEMTVNDDGMQLGGSGARVNTILDQDTLSSNSDTALATQQSIKAYVDAEVLAAGTGDITFTGSTINSPSNADITLNPGGTGAIAMPGITVNDNNITASRSNDNLNLTASGTGSVVIENELFITGNAIQRSDKNIGITFNSGGIAVNTGHNGTFALSADTGVSGSASVYCSDNSNAEYKANPSYDVGMVVGAIGSGGSSGGDITLKHLSGSKVFIQPGSSANGGTLSVQNIVAPSSGSGILSLADVQIDNAKNISNINSLAVDGVTITDNTISTNASNADLELSANGSGTVSINGLKFPTSDGSANQILKTDGSGTLSFVADSAGTITALNNQAANRLTTIGSTTTELDGEANATFDGSTLAITGNITATTSIANDAITIDDNGITASRSNDNLNLSANGTGAVVMSGTGGSITPSNNNANIMLHSNQSQAFGTKVYANRIRNDLKIDGSASDSSSTSDRYRNLLEVSLDLNGKDSTATNSLISRGPSNLLGVDVINTASGDSILGNASANNNFIYAQTSSTGDLTISVAASTAGSIEAEANSGSTITYADARVFNSNAQAGGSGTNAITNLYHYKVNASSGFTVTNEFGFHSPDDMQSLIGGVTLQNGDLTTTGLQLQDNCIQTHRSNDTLYVKTSGTGQIQLTPNGGDFGNYSTNSRFAGANVLYYEDLAVTPGSGNRHYKNMVMTNLKLTGSDSSNSNDRFRNQIVSAVDLNGVSITATSSQYRSRGPLAIDAYAQLTNSGSSAVAVGNATGGAFGVYSSLGSQNATITGTTGVSAYMEFGRGTGTLTVTDLVGFESIGLDTYDDTGGGTPGATSFGTYYHFRAGNHTLSGGGGTVSLTNDYGFYYEGGTGSNQYAFYSNTDTAESRVGTLERYREKVNALTNSTTITVDCNLAPVHTVTIAQATGFNLKNLATGQTVMLVVKQDGTGSRTATFTEEDSTAILFPGGQPTLSTAASSVDVLTFFNTGSEVIGNCVKAYAAS